MFHLRDNKAFIDAKWREKILLSSEILGQAPVRELQPDATGDRVRLDLMWNGSQLGIKDKNDNFSEVLEPDSAHPRIRGMLNLFLADPMPVEKAQVRFRYSEAEDLCGIWIDCSNEDIKALKDEAEWLKRQIETQHWVVEAGQKGKAFVIKNNEIFFEDAPLYPWLCSYDRDNVEIPLLSQIHLFSQPGPEINRGLVACGFDLLESYAQPIRSWAEFGAGYGNLTAAYSSFLEGASIMSSEIHPLAVNCLKANAERFFPQARLELSAAKIDIVGKALDLWILDPPRPGFPELFKALEEQKDLRPKHVLIYHCHNKGLAADSSLLKQLGYSLEAWSCVDAFPGTPYHEVISLWNLS